MENIKSSFGVAVLAALVSRLCCIVPFIAIVSGMTGGATMFSFLEPFRIPLILISVSILAFGFYQEYKPKNVEALRPCCRANAEKKSKKNRRLLWTMTLVSMLLISFPLYSHYFIKENSFQTVNSNNTKTMQLTVDGMSCQGCANNIMMSLSQTTGILKDTVIFETKKATITFDETKITEENIIKNIEAIGFTAYKQ